MKKVHGGDRISVCSAHRKKLRDIIDGPEPRCLVEYFLDEWNAVKGEQPKNKRFACYALVGKTLGFRQRQQHSECVVYAISSLFPDAIKHIPTTTVTATPTSTPQSKRQKVS